MKNRFNPELSTSPVLISRAKNRAEETWEDIERYEGLYQRSNLDNVKSLARKGRLKDKILKKSPRGHYGFVFNLSKGGVTETLYIPNKKHKRKKNQKLVSNRNYASKVMTDYRDNQLTIIEKVAKRRLQVAVLARNKMLALRTFKNSGFMLTKLN